MSLVPNNFKKPKLSLKWIGIIIIILFTVTMTINTLTTTKKTSAPSSILTGHTTPSDTVSSDTTNETLKALSAQVQLVSEQNKNIIAHDKEVEKKNKDMVNNLQQQFQNNLEKIKSSHQELNKSFQTKHSILKIPVSDSEYHIGGQALLNSSHSPENTLMWVDDMRSSFPENIDTINNSNIDTGTHLSSQSAPYRMLKTSDKLLPIPRYTIPINSTLYDSISWTGLIGRIPINGVVRDPYPFKVIVGRKDFAANGINIPDVEGVIVGGFAVGDMGMGCVRGNITSLTFIFPDGRISTKVASGNNKDSNDSKLGYLSTTNGNPCINGKYYGNAPEFLLGTVGLGAAQGAAGAYAGSQTTNSSNVLGGNTSSVTGSPGKFVAGQAGMNAASAASQWWTQREQNSFDAIYVSSNKPVAVNITQEISIDYNPTGRKVFYDLSKTNMVTNSLD